MKKMNRLFCILGAVCMIVSILAMSLGESSGKPAAEAPEEAGLAEIQGILDVQPVGNIEGMDLEALTTALAENAFGEYYDPVSGFRMLYPSILLFDEEGKGLVALSDDGNIRMTIESTPDGGQLSVPALMKAVQMENPDAVIREYTDPPCFVKENAAEEEYRIDFYCLSGEWLHHVILTCPETEKETIIPYVEYMVHSITNDNGEQG